ncbi:hypothetical protein CHUAL_012429 [Chamberlinius hualienensis]
MPSRKSAKNNSAIKSTNYHANDSSSTGDLNVKDEISAHFLDQLGGIEGITMPKHIALPLIPVDGEFVFELVMFVYTAMALGLQYVNLYRTVWWLPHSHNKYAVNFYLIDIHLMAYILIVLGRRFICCTIRWIILKLINVWSRKKMPVPVVVEKLMRGCIVLVLLWLMWCIAWKYLLVNLLYLFYPICMHLAVFKTNLTAFFEVHVTPALSVEKITQSGSKIKPNGAPLTPPSGEVRHLCSPNAEIVRKEVEYLKTDFNYRLKQVLFNSLLNTYFIGFLPCCFAQPFLYYDTNWMTQQLICFWLSSFTMYIVHMYPPQYCNVLHCSALHLGKWFKVEGPAAHIPHASWCSTILWQQGALVKHRRELFRAEGITNAAEPGNSTHARFYTFFRDPSSILCGLVGLQMTLILFQMILLICSKEWHYIMSHTLLITTNYYTLFNLIRDFLVLSKIYKTEHVIQHKISS